MQETSGVSIGTQEASRNFVIRGNRIWRTGVKEEIMQEVKKGVRGEGKKAVKEIFKEEVTEDPDKEKTEGIFGDSERSEWSSSEWS